MTDPRCLPGETPYQMVQRVGREADERMRQHVAEIDRHRAAGTLIPGYGLTIPLSVGTFDCNGNPKGSGWS